MGEPTIHSESPDPAPAPDPEGFRISLTELVVILGVVFVLAVILIPLSRGRTYDIPNAGNVEPAQPGPEATAPADE